MGKFRRVNDTVQLAPTNTPGPIEVGSEIFGDARVMVGLSVRMDPGNLTTLHVHGRRLDSDTGKLFGDTHVFTGGRDPNHGTERTITGNNLDNGPNRVMSGFWARAHPGDITSMLIWTKAINDDGQLEGLVPILTGVTPPGWEAEVVLPSPFVATGIAMRAARDNAGGGGDVTHIKGLFALLEPA